MSVLEMTRRNFLKLTASVAAVSFALPRSLPETDSFPRSGSGRPMVVLDRDSSVDPAVVERALAVLEAGEVERTPMENVRWFASPGYRLRYDPISRRVVHDVDPDNPLVIHPAGWLAPYPSNWVPLPLSGSGWNQNLAATA